MQSRWTDPDDIRPPSPIGVAACMLAIFALFAVALVAWAHDADAAIRCGGPCPTVPTTVGDDPTTTTSTTLATTTSVPAFTTTVGATTTRPTGCVDCNIPPPPTTAPSTVTTTATTAPPSTVTVATTVSPAAAPPLATTAIPAASTSASTPADELPVTGGDVGWLALFAVCLVALGFLAVAWVRT